MKHLVSLTVFNFSYDLMTIMIALTFLGHFVCSLVYMVRNTWSHVRNNFFSNVALLSSVRHDSGFALQQR